MWSQVDVPRYKKRDFVIVEHFRPAYTYWFLARNLIKSVRKRRNWTILLILQDNIAIYHISPLECMMEHSLPL